jgi:hypothetical protein
MGFLDRDEHEEVKQLERIAETLEFIARLLSIYLTPPDFARSVTLMPMPTGPVAPGATDTYTATALDDAGNTVVAATVSTVSSDDTIVSLVSNGSSNGVETGTWTAVAAGAATLTATATNVDGSVANTGTGDPGVITVSAPADLATSVSLA